ncbi:MAG: hypothetical protein JSW11_08015 [Candidatus Heimdallarchaeota archaeon]|nr:MAG: hypothetical protein JSW11_08015 [Candidatus Heimdallarchaeota archaeon]
MNVQETLQEHQLTPPTIIYPTGDEILLGIIRIKWTEAIDSQGHTVLYTVFYCQHGLDWRALKNDIQTTYYDWDTRNSKWGDYYIKVEARCSVGLTSESPEVLVKVQNELTPEIRFALTLLLFCTIIIILIGPILYRKRRYSTKSTVNLKNLKDLKIGLGFGSFTDQGLISKYTNDNCPFSLHQIQSMLEYSAVQYQQGKTETMYGPIPITRVKEIQQLKEPVREWNFISYWMNVRDDSVEDLRVSKIGGFVPAALLFFYPKKLDHIIIVKKNEICDIFKSVIGENTDISNFTNEVLNRMEKQLIKLFMKSR